MGTDCAILPGSTLPALQSSRTIADMSVMKRASQITVGECVLIGSVHWTVVGSSFLPPAEWILHLRGAGHRPKSVRCDASTDFIVA